MLHEKMSSSNPKLKESLLKELGSQKFWSNKEPFMKLQAIENLGHLAVCFVTISIN